MKFNPHKLLAAIMGLFVSVACFAASHREAPLISLDPAADNTDVYFFVGYNEANLARSKDDQRVVMIMNVNPGQEPGDGPN